MLPLMLPSRPIGEVLKDLFDSHQTERFNALRSLSRRYRGLVVYEDYRKRRAYYASMALNLQADADFYLEMHFEPAYLLEIAPVWAWLSVKDVDTGLRVYTDPAYIEVACRNPRGFGVIERPGWRSEAEACFWPRKMVEEIEVWLTKNPRIDY